MNVYSSSVLKTAKEKISSQPYIPVSPGQFDPEGQPQMCLAVALAWSGIFHQQSPQAADAFVEHVLTTQNKDLVRSTFDNLGWGSYECDIKMKYNDSHEASERKQRCISFLNME